MSAAHCCSNPFETHDAEAEEGKSCVVKVVMTDSSEDGAEWQNRIGNSQKGNRVRETGSAPL